MNAVDVIAVRRDGGRHTFEELKFIAQGAADGSIPDYQLSAWLMAAYLHPLDEQETAWLTTAMAESGDRLDLTGLPKPWVDKHSTGGVGDKTSIVLLPMLAACGLTVVKMSGRGLGITGGTVDKLASIPGFRVDLSPEEMKEQAARIGLAVTGQTPNLAPADKTLYALRDVTGTVESIPLIVSSILSKKIAGGAETIVLDVKCGSGAFMARLEDARRLGESLVKTGQLCGLKVSTSISDMSQPLGAAIGNALEVREALDVLEGKDMAPPTARFRELCVHYTAESLELSGKIPSRDEARKLAEDSLTSGKALEKAHLWIEQQGGNLADLPTAPVRVELKAEQEGWIAKCDARKVGQIVIDLGGGRHRKEDAIDPSVGIVLHVEVGDKAAKGQTLAEIHASTAAKADEAISTLKQAFEFSPSPVEKPPLFL